MTDDQKALCQCLDFCEAADPHSCAQVGTCRMREAPTVKDSLPVQCPACGSVPAILEETTPDQGMQELAFKIADESAVALLECNLVHDGDRWLNTATAEDADYPAIFEAIEYLELRGMLEHHPTSYHLVRVVEQGGAPAMTDYKRKRWSAMVSKARRQLAGSCPLQEDEAIVWAAERIKALEATVRVCRHHCRPIFGAAHPVTHAINDVMGVKR